MQNNTTPAGRKTPGGGLPVEGEKSMKEKVSRKKREKRAEEPVKTTWVYDDELGWINVNLFLEKIRKIECELSACLKRTG